MSSEALRSPSSCPRSTGAKRETKNSRRRRRSVDLEHPADPAQGRGIRGADRLHGDRGPGDARRRGSGSGAQRYPDAREDRAGAPRGRARPRRRGAGHPDDRPGLPAVRRAGGESGRVLLPAEAVQQRRARRAVPTRRGDARAEEGESRAQEGNPAPRGSVGGAAGGRQPRLRGGAEASRDGRSDRLDRPGDGRERDREGSRRALPARPVGARRRTVRVDQLRGAAGEPPRVRAVRAREGLVHGRRAGQGRTAGRRARRDVLPGRDRRDDPAAPGQASAGPPGARGGARRRDGSSGYRRPHHRRDESRSGAGDPRWDVPERPVLPAERDFDAPARAARAQG